MNELPISIFGMLLALDLIIIAYSLHGISFDKPTTVDKIIASVIASPLSFILASSIINGTVVENYVDTTGYHYIPVQSLPLHYFLLGFAVLMGVITLLLIAKFISDHFESLDKKSSIGDWHQNSFSKRRKK